jgi:hypothetical protein
MMEDERPKTTIELNLLDSIEDLLQMHDDPDGWTDNAVVPAEERTSLA